MDRPAESSRSGAAPAISYHGCTGRRGRVRSSATTRRTEESTGCRTTSAGACSTQRRSKGPSISIVARHCLEGLLEDGAFLEVARRATSETSRLYLELADLDHLLAARNPSLLWHEYYRYFSARAVDIFLRQVGFRLESLWSLFGGSYMGVIACRAPETVDLRDAYRDLETIVRRHRKVLIWGTSGRCISLLSHMAWDSAVVGAGVDIDPEKQGRFLPVTGQRVLSPSEAVAFALTS